MFSAPTQSSANPNIAPTTETAVARAPKWTCTPATAADFPFFVELELEFEPPTGPVKKKLPATAWPSPVSRTKFERLKRVGSERFPMNLGAILEKFGGRTNRKEGYLPSYALASLRIPLVNVWLVLASTFG